MKHKLRTYLVGGAVRDMLMGITPKDRDWVVVGSTPQEMLDLGFSQVGKDFPVYLHPETKEEYALARIERKTGIGHTGFDCVFDSSVTLESDLERRDLSMNAIAYDVASDTFIDPFNGRLDIANRTLRAVSHHFAEDPLRVLRVARFAARYGFDVEPSTLAMMRNIVDEGELKHLSGERIFIELTKAMSEKDPARFISVLNDAHALMSSFDIGSEDVYKMRENAKQLLSFDNVDDRIIYLFRNIEKYTFSGPGSRFNLPSNIKLLLSKIDNSQFDLDMVVKFNSPNIIMALFKQMDVIRRPEIIATVLLHRTISNPDDTIYITTKLMPLIDKVRNVVKEVVIPEDVVGRDIKVMIDGLIKAAIEEHTSN